MVHIGLGLLYKELWQLETACAWFDIALKEPVLTIEQKAIAYAELGDTLVWRNQNLSKAVELLRLALEMGEKSSKTVMALAHGLLRQGRPQQAQSYVQSSPSVDNFEAHYLQGLIHYRNGSTQKAKDIWKPLLKRPSMSIRDYHIKQDILLYYYDHAPYEVRDYSKVN
jgi:tetratricopeptide (TPR) repeat protein